MSEETRIQIETSNKNIVKIIDGPVKLSYQLTMVLVLNAKALISTCLFNVTSSTRSLNEAGPEFERNPSISPSSVLVVASSKAFVNSSLSFFFFFFSATN